MCYEIKTYKNEQGLPRARVFSHGIEKMSDITPSLALKTVKGWQLVDEQDRKFKR